MKEVTLTRTNQRALTFNGEEIADATTWAINATRWVKAKVYRSDKGRFILGLGRITQWQGESNDYSAMVCNSKEEVVSFLEELAPALAEEIAAKLEVVENV